jgi:hypothetical protein
MTSETEARYSHLELVRSAMLDHMAATEHGLRGLPGIGPTDADRIIASVRCRHERILRKIDGQIAQASYPTV